jgi:hypothetical protein
MKLPKGPLKVIFTDPSATEENEKRARANGTRFKAPFWVCMEGNDDQPVLIYMAFAVRGHMRLRSAVNRFPNVKVFPKLRDLRNWMESTGELELDVCPPDTYPQVIETKPPTTIETTNV